MMLVTISPALFNVGETVCSLHFASRCRLVELGVTEKTVLDGSTRSDGALSPKRERGAETPSSKTPTTTPSKKSGVSKSSSKAFTPGNREGLK